jgi:hypothetical protein
MRAQPHGDTAQLLQHFGPSPAKLQMDDASEELPERAGIDKIKVELTVIDGRILRHGQPASMISSIANTHLINRTRPSWFAIYGEVDKEGLQVAHCAQKADHISKDSPLLLEFLGLRLSDLGRGPDACDIEIGSLVDHAHINPALPATQRDLGGLQRIGGQANCSGEIIGRPEGQHGDGFFELEELGEGFGNRTVAPPITIKSAFLPCAFSSRLRSFLELATTMRAWQFSENQEDSAGTAASALEAPGLIMTNTCGLDLLIGLAVSTPSPNPTAPLPAPKRASL